MKTRLNTIPFDPSVAATIASEIQEQCGIGEFTFGNGVGPHVDLSKPHWLRYTVNGKRVMQWEANKITLNAKGATLDTLSKILAKSNLIKASSTGPGVALLLLYGFLQIFVVANLFVQADRPHMSFQTNIEGILLDMVLCGYGLLFIGIIIGCDADSERNILWSLLLALPAIFLTAPSSFLAIPIFHHFRRQYIYRQYVVESRRFNPLKMPSNEHGT